MRMALPARKLATLEDLLRAEDEGRRVEIIDGELVEKEAGGWKHASAHTNVPMALTPWFRGRGGDGHPGGWIFVVECHIVAPAGDVVMPDVSGWRRERAPTTDDFPVAIPPDWICEVVYSTHARDLGRKREIYHQMGVPHYWVLDLKGNVLMVFRHSPAGYLHVQTAAPGDRARLEPFDAVELPVWELFGLEDPP